MASRLYKGWVYSRRYFGFQWTSNNIDPVIEYGVKEMDELINVNSGKVVRGASFVGDVYTWKEPYLDKYRSNPHVGDCHFFAFLNPESFKAKFEIGEPYKTASSCACRLKHQEFTCEMFLPDLWPLLQTISFDISDPTNVKKYIEGEFAFVKKGKAVSLVGVENV